MRLVTLNSKVLKHYLKDPEMLRDARRPSVLVIRMTYKGKRYDFAVPLRSNINPSAPRNEYFPLPTRSTTRSKCHHGIHYIKMFPVNRSDLHPFRTEGNPFAELVKNVIDKNEKSIVSECKAYLSAYEAGIRPAYSTDIDLLISLMKQ